MNSTPMNLEIKERKILTFNYSEREKLITNKVLFDLIQNSNLKL